VLSEAGARRPRRGGVFPQRRVSNFQMNATAHKSPTTEVTSRLKYFIVTAVDVAASSSGLRGRRRTCLTILQRAWSANFKMVQYVLLLPLRPELLAAKSTAVTIKWLRREVTSVVGL
jgi:hypothetical protein